MKKTVKMLAFTLALVMLLGIFAGCALFGRNEKIYRAQQSLKIGDEEITTGILYDQFISDLNMWGQYVSSLDEVFALTTEQIYTSYMKLDAYKNSNPKVYTKAENPYVGDIKNVEYLNKVEATYSIAIVKYSMFSYLDSFVENYVVGEIGELGTLDDDSSRDFLEYDDWSKVAWDGEADVPNNYAEYVYRTNYTNDDMQEYFAEYYGLDEIINSTIEHYGIEDYKYKTAADATARIENINKRLEKYYDDNSDKDDDKVAPVITYEQLKEYQERAIKKLTRSLVGGNSYYDSIEDYMKPQLENSVISSIVGKYNYENVYQDIESSEGFYDILTNKFNLAISEAKYNYSLNAKQYETDVEELSNNSYLFDRPEVKDENGDYQDIYEGKYVFVKNLLIPFTDAQSASLDKLSSEMGGTSNKAYIKARNDMAAGIVARDFTVDNEKDENAKVSGLLGLNASKEVTISTKAVSEYGFDGFTANQKTGKYSGKSTDLTSEDRISSFMELMGMFNTDTGQHSNKYDYVVRLGEEDTDYQHRWVEEFWKAAYEAADLTKFNADGTVQDGEMGYSMCVSSFGVHIIIVTGQVMPWDSFDTSKVGEGAGAIYKTDSNEYDFLVSAYGVKSKAEYDKNLEKLKDEYFGNKITITNEFKKFLKEYNLSYDFDEEMKRDK